jgi:L-alanine-DL-glutamate epimerase-like enolase superfamily enzyme
VGLGIAIINGIEAALWDLKGKMCNCPVYELLGGRKHDKLLCYASGGPSNYPKDELQALPGTAYLLNPARGPLVKENDLLTTLCRIKLR